MFHVIKRKTIGGIQSRGEPNSAEYTETKERLHEIQKGLNYALESIGTSRKAWTSISHQWPKFCENLQSLYSKNDRTQEVFKKSAEGATVVNKELVLKEGNTATNTHSIELMVKGYLAEIQTLKPEYAKVEAARKDYAMCERKMSKLDVKSSKNGRKEKHMERLETVKAKYDSVLKGVTHRMNLAIDKADSMLRAIFVAYWMEQKNSIDTLMQNAAGPMEYAASNEDQVFALTESGKRKSAK